MVVFVGSGYMEEPQGVGFEIVITRRYWFFWLEINDLLF